MKNKEMPEGLVEEVARAISNGGAFVTGNPSGKLLERPLFEADYDKAKAALSVIAPYYEKQIEELKAQIPVWRDISEAPKDGESFAVVLNGNVCQAWWEKSINDFTTGLMNSQWDYIPVSELGVIKKWQQLKPSAE